jgi:hypothetical protein
MFIFLFLGGKISKITNHQEKAIMKKTCYDIKPRPNHRLYLETLSKMSPEEKLDKTFELSEMSKALFLTGLRMRFPEYSEEQIHKLFLERLKLCYNRNY